MCVLLGCCLCVRVCICVCAGGVEGEGDASEKDGHLFEHNNHFRRLPLVCLFVYAGGDEEEGDASKEGDKAVTAAPLPMKLGSLQVWYGVRCMCACLCVCVCMLLCACM